MPSQGMSGVFPCSKVVAFMGGLVQPANSANPANDSFYSCDSLAAVTILTQPFSVLTIGYTVLSTVRSIEAISPCKAHKCCGIGELLDQKILIPANLLPLRAGSL